MDPQATLTLLKDDLATEDMAVRVNAVRRLPLVAKCFGDSKPAKDSLFAFIDKLSKELDEDELLLGLADSLCRLTGYFKTSMVPVLERLAAMEETVVRDKACECYLLLFRQADKNEMAGVLVPSITKLAQSESVIAKISALNVISEVFQMVSDGEKKLFLDKINAMFSEDSLMLRRILATKLGVLCKFLPKEVLLADIMNHIKTLSCDDSDQVKIHTVESIVKLAALISAEENKNHIVPLIIQMTSDKSWKVKHHLAKEFSHLAHAVGPEVTDGSLISIFSTLLRDPENEVRIIAVRSLKNFANIISSEKISTIIAYMNTLAKDSVALVRVGTCEVLCVILETSMDSSSMKELIKFRIQPIVVELLADKEIEVKIEATKLLKPLARHYGPAVLDLVANNTLHVDLDSPNWRLRHTSLQALMDLSYEFRATKALDKYFKKQFMLALHDKAFKVRQLAVVSLKKLIESLDQQSRSTIARDMLKAVANPKEFYIYRVTALYALEVIIPTLEDKALVKEAVSKYLYPLLEDSVANVRQVALVVVLRLAKSRPADFGDELRTALAHMNEKESDKEVKAILAKSN